MVDVQSSDRFVISEFAMDSEGWMYYRGENIYDMLNKATTMSNCLLIKRIKEKVKDMEERNNYLERRVSNLEWDHIEMMQEVYELRSDLQKERCMKKTRSGLKY